MSSVDKISSVHLGKIRKKYFVGRTLPSPLIIKLRGPNLAD
jgi:hypothetical protein